MKNSKLASLLSKLSPKEFKEFGKFVKSPYFNSNSNVVKLYDLISKYFPNLDHPKLAKENIYLHIYPDEKYNDSTSRGLLSAALKLGEDFLAVSHLKDNEDRYKEFLLNELCERKIFDLFNIHLKKTRTELENIGDKDEDYFYLKYRIETLINSIDSKSYIPLTQKDIPGDINIKDTENLIIYFLVSILKRYNYLFTKTGSLNVALDMKFLDEIIAYLEKTDLREIPILNYHYNRAMLYRSNMDEKYFLELRKIFFDENNGLNQYERYNLLASISNYCVQKKKFSGDELSQAQYEQFKFAIENNILTVDHSEPIHPVMFSNIVNSQIHLDKENEAREFIQNFKDRLAPDRMESAENFNMARIYFKEKKFDKALECLELVQNEDIYYKIGVKNLYAMVYYDKNLIEELILLLESYKSFLNNTVVLGPRLRENHMNFILILFKILKLKDFGEKIDIEYLKHEINDTPSVLNGEWLIKKITELI